jgi:MFS family permease
MAAAGVEVLEEIPQPKTWLARLGGGFLPPSLPPASRRAFRSHMAFTLLDAVFAGITANTPLMAVKAIGATDAQLQLPLAMASIGLFASVLSGNVMALRRKKPWVVAPGIAGAVSALLMAWTSSAVWFLLLSGAISIFDFAMRPAVPSILRSIYPDQIRSHIAGTMRQYGSIVFLASTLFSAAFLSAASNHTIAVIRIELMFAGIVSLAAYACFNQLPDLCDGCAAEATPLHATKESMALAALGPLRNTRYRRFLTIFFVFAFANLFHMGIVPAFFARDMGLGYVQASLLLHIIPNLAAFLVGGRLSAWIDRNSVWRSYSFITLMWGLDPVLLTGLPSFWPAVIIARVLRGPATLGSNVLCFFTGVHSFSRPGADTSRYMAALFLVNGFARLLAPTASAIMLAYLSRRSIIFIGGLGVLAASALFRANDTGEHSVDAAGV